MLNIGVTSEGVGLGECLTPVAAGAGASYVVAPGSPEGTRTRHATFNRCTSKQVTRWTIRNSSAIGCSPQAAGWVARCGRIPPVTAVAVRAGTQIPNQTRVP